MVSLMFELVRCGCLVCSDLPGEMRKKGNSVDLLKMGKELFFFFNEKDNCFVVVMLALEFFFFFLMDKVP
jgi:hypothetical protein